MLLAAVALLLQETAARELRAGRPSTGRIAAASTLVEPERIDPYSGFPPIHAEAFRFTVDRRGPWRVELHSHEFNSYLILRDADGVVLAENDNGFYGNHARIVADDLVPGAEYEIYACALHGREGEFTLTLSAGAPPVLSPDERRGMALADAEEAVRILKERDGAESATHAWALSHLAEVLYGLGRARDALAPSKQGLILRNKILGREHMDTATSFNELGTLAFVLGDLESCEKLYRNALDIRRKVHGLGHPWTADSLHHLGQIYLQMKRPADALPLLREALQLKERVLGREHASTVKSLHHLGLCVEMLDGPEGARAIFERSLGLAEKAYGPGSGFTASVLQALGRCYSNLERYAEAEPLLRRAIAILKAAGASHFDPLSKALHSMAISLRSQGRVTEAREYYEQALAAAIATGDERHEELGKIRLGFAMFHSESERWNEATVLLEQLAASLAGGTDDLLQARVQSELGVLQVARGLPREGEQRLEKTLPRFVELLGPDHPDTIYWSIGLAKARTELGELQASRDLLEPALQQALKLQGPDGWLGMLARNNLAKVLLAQGYYADSRAHLAMLLEQRERFYGLNSREWVLAAGQAALALSRLGQWEESLRLLEKAERIWRRNLRHLTSVGSTLLNNLAVTQWRLGDPQAAESHYQEALALAVGRFGEGSRGVVTALNNLATFYRSERRLEAALATLRRAEKALGELETAALSQVAAVHVNLGRVLSDLGRLEDAAPYFETAVENALSGFGEQHEIYARILEQSAFYACDRGDFERAWELAVLAFGVRRGHIERELWTLSEGEQFKFLAKQREVLHLLLSIAPRLDQAALEFAYGALLEWKGRATRTLVSSRSRAFDEHAGGRTGALQELREVQSGLSRMVYASNAAAAEQRDAELERLRSRRNALERELHADLESDGMNELPSASAVRATLPKRTALLDFAVHPFRSSTLDTPAPVDGPWTKDHVVAFVTRRDGGSVVRIDLGPADRIARAIGLTARGLQLVRGGAPAFAPQAGRGLRELLWNPLASHLEDLQQIFVVPDGVLGGFPLEILTTGDDRYLIEEYSIVYLQDALSLASGADSSPASSRGVLLAGGIDYEGSQQLASGREAGGVPGRRSERWRALPGTRDEADALARLHTTCGAAGPLTRLQGSDATEKRIKDELQRHGVLHIATHGFFQPEGVASLWEQAQHASREEARHAESRQVLDGLPAGLLSGLVCAGANHPDAEASEDGFLTAEEVAWLDLSGTDLVVLSACETALGRSESGEGMIGLRRAFHLAGARTVISSLWSVDDVSTRRLMESFYSNLWKHGQFKLDALRNAQLEMLKQNRADFNGNARPETWGAFVLSGDWE